jgi:small nuclear ribonucleoprotein (snRNP)-like protein
MDKKLFVHLQGGRKVSGTLRGYDLFLNLVIDNALEETTPAQKHPLGTIVRGWLLLSLNQANLTFISCRSCAETVSHPWRRWKRRAR